MASEGTKYCNECGQQLRTDADFCDRCGTEQSASESGRTALSRRQLIVGGVGGVAVGLFGVSVFAGDDATDVEFREATDPWSNEQRDQTATTASVSTEFSLPEGTYATRTFGPSIPATVEYTVRSDSPVSVWLLDNEEFSFYESGEEFLHYERAHDSGELAAATARIAAGDYQFILDNTYQTRPEPEGGASGTLELAVRV